MLTVEELRKIALESTDSISSKILDNVKSEIDKAARAGYNIYRTTNQEFRKELVKNKIQKELSELGFQVSYEYGSFYFELDKCYSDYILTIQW